MNRFTSSQSRILFLFFLLVLGCGESSPHLAFHEWPSETDADSSVSFISFGDWGDGGEAQKRVATAMENYCQQNPCEFVLTLGDNIYPTGVQSTTDPQWEEKFTSIYTDLNLPFYVTSGNHDLAGSLQAEIDYSDVNPLWIMPASQYNFTWPQESINPLVEIFVVNAVPFTEEDKEWLETAIEASHAGWLILARHFPFITNVNVGPDSDDPLMEEAICNRVDLVLSGHNHFFSLLRGPKGNCWIEQVILGTGGAQLQEIIEGDRDEGRLVTTDSTYGFGWFQVSPDTLNFRMISDSGDILFEASWTK